jgi:hypothetical protein
MGILRVPPSERRRHPASSVFPGDFRRRTPALQEHMRDAMSHTSGSAAVLAAARFEDFVGGEHDP